MIVKVCGMRDAENIKQLEELGTVDWMGFIFYPCSPRNVETVPDYLPIQCKRVGVFVNEPHSNILLKQREFELDYVQLHGDETPEYCNTLRTLMNNQAQLIKVFQIETIEDLNKVTPYTTVVDYLLFETKCTTYGGSGKHFDWSILHHYQGNTPFFITGGIGADDAEAVKAFRHPQFMGIDLNSRFELSPALKNISLIDQFIKQLKP